MLVASGEAASYRPDLEAAQIGTGHHAFVIGIPSSEGEIDCRVNGERLLTGDDSRGGAQQAGDFWDGMGAVYAQMPPRARWPDSPHIVRYQNERACGRIIPGGSNRGAIELFKDMAKSDLPVARAVSVGCGPGHKELMLIQEGIVSQFDLYDVSQESLTPGDRWRNRWGWRIAFGSFTATISRMS